MNEKKLHVHFMGIGGSALSGVAILAKRAGFKVSGCELQRQTAYSPTLSKFGIKAPTSTVGSIPAPSAKKPSKAVTVDFP